MDLRYGSAPERRGAIVRRLRSTGFCAVADLADQLNVSEMTVRRDLRKLADGGEVRVVHGGARLPGGELPSIMFVPRRDVNAVAKERIARHASALIGLHDTIAVDAGTTTDRLAGALPDGFVGSVVTHSVPVITRMLGRPTIRVVGLGGDLYPASQAFVGPATVDAASSIRVRIMFLGAAALDDRGIYCATDVERPTKQALMSIADRVVLLVDHSKFATSAPMLLCGFGAINTLVTDRRPTDQVCSALERDGVELVVAPVGERRT